MMFTCAAPGYTDSLRDHSPVLSAREGAAKTTKTPRAAPLLKLVRNRKGRSLRIDIHCHYLNPEVQARVAPMNTAQYDPSRVYANALTGEVNTKQMKDRAPRLSTIEVRLKDMDRMGIDIQAVSPAPNQCSYWAEPGLGLELSRMVNDRLAEIVATWPDRFVGLGTVPLQNADMAVAELERCVNKLGLRGVEINPNVNGMDLTDPRLNLDRFFAKVQELGVVIFMHPLGFTQGERFMDHYFNNVIGNPLETTVAVSHLIFDGVMERFPKLKIVLPHAGGYLGHYWARMDRARRPPRLSYRHQEKTDELPAQVLLRHHHLRPQHAAPPDRQVGRRPRRAGDGLSLRHGRGGSGGSHRKRGPPFARRKGPDHGRKCGASAQDQAMNATSAQVTTSLSVGVQSSCQPVK